MMAPGRNGAISCAHQLRNKKMQERPWWSPCAGRGDHQGRPCNTYGRENMDRQEAIEFLMDHYENPRNYGPLEDPDVSLTGGNPGCADLITMHARFDKDGKLEEVHW